MTAMPYMLVPLVMMPAFDPMLTNQPSEAQLVEMKKMALSSRRQQLIRTKQMFDQYAKAIDEALVETEQKLRGFSDQPKEAVEEGQPEDASAKTTENPKMTETTAESLLQDPLRMDPLRMDPLRMDPLRMDPLRMDPQRMDPQRLYADQRLNANPNGPIFLSGLGEFGRPVF